MMIFGECILNMPMMDDNWVSCHRNFQGTASWLQPCTGVLAY